MICLAAKYRIRRIAILSFSNGPGSKGGLHGSGIEVCQRSSCRCSSSQTDVIDNISSIVNSSGAISDVEEREKKCCLLG